MSSLLVLHPVPVRSQDWEVFGSGEGLTLDQDEDDWIDGDAEISLSIQWSHVDEERSVFTQLTTTRSGSHNWDDPGSTLSGLLQNFSTTECDESDYIHVNARLSKSESLASSFRGHRPRAGL